MRRFIAWLLGSALTSRWASEEDRDRKRFQAETSEFEQGAARADLEKEIDTFLDQIRSRRMTREERAWYESIRRREAIIG